MDRDVRASAEIPRPARPDLGRGHAVRGRWATWALPRMGFEVVAVPVKGLV